MVESPQFVYDVVTMMLFATLRHPVLRPARSRRFLVHILRARYQVIVPIIFVLCTVGSFAIASRLFDVWVMLGFGVLGFVLRLLNYPMAPLVLGLVLGDLLEKILRRGLVLSDGDLTPFFTRPISALLITLIVLVIISRFLARRPA